MPLPDVQTLQNSEAVAAQQHPDFMTNIPNSPHIEAPNLNAPQATPAPAGQPVPRGLGNNSIFSKDFLAKVYGPGPNTRTPGNLNTMDYSEAQAGVDRYPTFTPGADNEELYGLNQSPIKQFTNGVLKGVAGFGTGVLSAFMTIPDTLQAIGSGKVSDLYNSGLENGAQKWLNSLENSLPNYMTHEETDRNVLLRAVPGFGAANFWGNTFIKGLGPMAGAVLGTVAQDALIGLATGGVGDAALIPAQFGKASLWLNKILTGGERVEQTIADATRLGRTSEQILDIQKLQLAASSRKILNGGEYLTNLYTTGRTMSAAGANQQYEQVKKDLTNSYIQKNGFQPINEDQQNIEDTAKAAGNAKFAIDTSLMMLAEGISLDNILSPIGTAREKYMSTLQKKFGLDAKGITIDEAGRATYAGRAATQEAGPIKGALEAPKAATSMKDKAIDALNAAKGAIPTPAEWKNSLRAAVPGLVSGGLLFGAGMSASEFATKNYYEDKYNDKIRGNLNDAVNATLNGMASAFGTKEGRENIFVGGLMGLLLGGISKFAESRASGRTRGMEREDIVNMVNQATTSGFMHSNFDTASKSLGNAEKLKSAAATGDVFESENIQHNEFVNFALSHAKNGLEELGSSKIDMMKEVTGKAFTDMFKMEDTPENQKIAKDYVDKLQRKYKEIIKTRDLIDRTYRNPFDRADKNTDEDGFNKYWAWENAKDTLTSLASVSRDVADRVDRIRKSTNELYSVVGTDTLQQLTSPKKLFEYNKSLKARAADLQKNLESDASLDKAGDREHLNLLNKIIPEVDNILSRTSTEKAHLAYHTLSDLSTFEKLLNYKANGEGLGGTYHEVPKEALAQLASYGGDLNKLDLMKQYAADSYDRLSSPKGFEDFFNAEMGRKAAQKPPEEPVTPKPGATAVPNPTTTPEEPTLKVVNPYSKQEKSYTVNQDIPIPQGKGKNPVTAKIVSVNEDGSVNVIHKDGTQEVIPARDLFAAPTKTPTKTETIIKTDKVTATPVTDPAPVPTPPVKVESTEAVKEDPKPTLLLGIQSTSTPKYNIPDLPDNDFHKREQGFLLHAGSSDPEIFNQKSIPHLRIQIVTPSTQEAFGFKPNWIQETTTGDFDPKTSIRGVHIISKPDGDYFSDEKGNPLKKVGKSDEPVNTTQVVYTNIRTSDFVNDKGQTKYHDIDQYTPEQQKKIQDWWDNNRNFWLSQTNHTALPKFKYAISKGRALFKTGFDNTVVKAELVDDSDLFKPIIDIARIGTSILVNPIETESGEGIPSTKESINVGKGGIPNGQTMLNHGANLTFLNNHHFESDKARDVFDLLKHFSDQTKPKEERVEAREHLKKLLYIIEGDSRVKASKSTTNIVRDVNDDAYDEPGTLFLGLSQEGIDLYPDSLDANKAKILDFLQNDGFHNIDVPLLDQLKAKAKGPKEDLVFKELKVIEGKLVVDKEWPSYNHYLLTLGGRRIPVLTTNLLTPEDGQINIINKYATLQMSGYVAPPSKPINQPPITSPTPKGVEVSSKDNEVVPVTFQNAEGKEIAPKRFYEFVPKKDAQGNIIGVDKIVGYRVSSVDAPLQTPQNPSAHIPYVEGALEKVTPKEAASELDDLSFTPGALTSFDASYHKDATESKEPDLKDMEDKGIIKRECD